MGKNKSNILRWVLSEAVKAVADYKMIENGDKIAIGLSGGKDSTTLLYVLAYYQKYYPYDFEIQPIHVTMGFEDMDITPLKDFCTSLGLPLYIQPGEIGRIVFDARQEKNPCALCANLRRGALNSAAVELGCNKVALAHHLDDAIETFFMSFFYNAQLRTFSPRTYLDRTGLTIIRPFVYIPERDIIRLSKKAAVPVIDNPCPANRRTKREEAKELVTELSKRYPRLRENFINALKNFDQRNLWPKVMR
ncbi:tRNA(Ile)-lysidine synthase TilS/MesJ [Desulfohalotomaculum tongense]|uniref:tRNA 2-thiocytidine biosynthesis TtcA family protein n=1 Tax=Desulforadius tongensis TaxID=1216062 RepID=UPI00195657B1|nr:tRNA 2-thiocytidine biosynthesis TtcA family protein [Desulforadius tongensis]MBM7855395.1 tRNA(Ile)-lysidine synthase TilS/MesJ [Desulforadius tongensis]